MPPPWRKSFPHLLKPVATYGSDVEAEDLRGGAALVLAALGAEGTSTVSGLSHIDRGYYDLGGKLSSLGADIRRLP